MLPDGGSRLVTDLSDFERRAPSPATSGDRRRRPCSVIGSFLTWATGARGTVDDRGRALGVDPRGRPRGAAARRRVRVTGMGAPGRRQVHAGRRHRRRRRVVLLSKASRTPGVAILMLVGGVGRGRLALYDADGPDGQGDRRRAPRHSPGSDARCSRRAFDVCRRHRDLALHRRRPPAIVAASWRCYARDPSTSWSRTPSVAMLAAVPAARPGEARGRVRRRRRLGVDRRPERRDGAVRRRSRRPRSTLVGPVDGEPMPGLVDGPAARGPCTDGLTCVATTFEIDTAGRRVVDVTDRVRRFAASRRGATACCTSSCRTRRPGSR